jgi:uracil-DNA glycosylase
MPLPHPSWRNTGWIRRHPWFEAELLPALQMEVARTLRRP